MSDLDEIRQKRMAELQAQQAAVQQQQAQQQQVAAQQMQQQVHRQNLKLRKNRF